MLNIAVCDDEAATRKELSSLLRSWFEARKEACQITPFSTAEALLAWEKPFHIVFLDIRMEGLDGLQAAFQLRKRGDCAFLVFVTALQEYVYDAFEVEASDYLLKPIVPERLSRTMERILRRLQDTKEECLLIQKGAGCRSIPLADILYCEAFGRKVALHTTQGVLDYYFKFSDLEQRLNSHFFRCHRSYFVNLRYVCGYEQGMALLENGETLPVSRLRGEAFTQAIFHYMKGMK